MKILKILLLLFIAFSLTIAAPKKYALALYHFNLQYVAGDHEIEKRIIEESIIPLFDFYENHPEYKGDFEIQAWALEVMDEQYKPELERLRTLINNGQLDLIVVHYSDQLFIGYPALDMQRSVEISDKILDELNLERTRIFLGQEIQYTAGLISALNDDFDVISLSGNPYGYYLSNAMPLMKESYGGKEMLVFPGGGKKDLGFLQWDWAFFDDGEVFSTKDYRSDFYRVPEWEKANMDKFKKMAEDGYEFVTISEFVDILLSHNYEPPEMDYLPEGTWNMGGGGPYNWMGKQRSGNEKDGLTRARNFITRGEVMVAEKVLEKSGKTSPELEAILELAWKHLLLSEVSDASGWSPWPIEVEYTDLHADTAEALSKEIISALIRPNSSFFVDTKRARFNYRYKKRGITPLTNAPVPIHINGTDHSLNVEQIYHDLIKVSISVTPNEDQSAEIQFSLEGKDHFYSAPMGEETLFKIPTDLRNDPILSLSNGLFSLGNGWNLIKDNYIEHIAATWDYDANTLTFREELRHDIPSMNMDFYLVKGSPKKALRIANRINTWPLYQVSKDAKDVTLTRMLPEHGNR